MGRAFDQDLNGKRQVTHCVTGLRKGLDYKYKPFKIEDSLYFCVLD